MILAVILLIGAIPFYYLYRALSPLQIFGDARWLVEQLFEIMKLIPKAYFRLKANVLLEKPSPFLQAAAVGRVLCTSGDFDTLIYTAINIQAMEEDGTRYLLGDDTVREHLEKLITSSEKALASSFSCALAHLLLRGLSAKLVQTEGSALKRLKAFVERLMYHGELERLKRKVGLISDRLEPGAKSSFTLPENLVEVKSYFRLLKLLFDEEAGCRELYGWLDETIKEQQNAKVSTPLVICLVASTVRILKEGIESEGASSRLQIRFRDSEVQKKRLEVIRELAGTVETEMQLLRSDPSQSDWSVLGLIAEAFTACRSESVQHLEAELWLLEQALSLSMLKRHEQGWKFVAETSAHLLVSLNDPTDPNNRLRCANTLSRCLYAMRDHFKPDELIQAVSPALEKLVNSSPRFKPNMAEVWLLEQVLLFSTAPQHITGVQFVAESSVDLLLSTDDSEDPAPNPAAGNPRDSPSNNRLRCTNLLSRSLHVMRDHLTPDEFIETISPALDKLSEYWAQFQDDFNLYPDLNRAVVLPSWLEIRNVLDRPDESGWGPRQQQQFGEAYPSLKLGFDAMASAAQGIEATPRVEVVYPSRAQKNFKMW
ncbi:hypothetical protein FRC00_006276 [Tulasnella sp. 408]|nr:hypothetical protein FRC00_006276 [Tulasnella sp. 408]